jgi:eukaryotic-like serine/threonine-protein kinase
MEILSDRYDLEDELGRGGNGVVYRARDRLLDRPVAIKVFNRAVPGDEAHRRFLNEARIVARLNHRNIVSVYDAGTADGIPYIVMELIDGESLHKQPPTALEEIVAIAHQLCLGLDHAHSQGIVHRDLKPENVLVTRDGVVKLMDFGLARSSLTSRLTVEGTIVGTVFYLAPEQALGQAPDPRTDLYALGVMLYELTTGRLPFTADDPLAVISQHLHAPVVPPRAHDDTIDPRLDALIVRLLAKQPQERPPSAAEVGRTLEQLRVPDTPETTDAGKLSLLDRIVRGRLIGRDRELSAARGCLHAALRGRGHVLLVSGEPGVGKTRLVREVLAEAQVRGARVLSTQCYAEGTSPYGPIAQMLRETLGDATRGIPELPQHVLADLLLIAPELRERFPNVAPGKVKEHQAEEQRVLESVAQWSFALAASAPLVLFIDDVHWADSGTLMLVRHLARRGRQHPLFIILTYREVDMLEANQLDEVLLDLNRERLSSRVKVRRLTMAQTREMLAAMFTEEISMEFLKPIYDETEGNPFFVEEVVKALVEEGQLSYGEGGWQRPEIQRIIIPQSVRGAVTARVRRLPGEAQETLTLAAIIGREFDFDTLRLASDLDEDTLIGALEQAERAQIIEEVRQGGAATFAFAHALIHSSLRESISTLRRNRLHRRVADAIQALRPADYENLAFHYAEIGDEEQAGRYYRLAGHRSRRRYANFDAIRFYSEALVLADSVSAERFDLLAARASVYDVLARREQQRADVDEMIVLAERLNEDSRRCDALLALADYYVETDHQQAQEPAERAREFAVALDDPAREGHARRCLGWVAIWHGEYARSQQELQRATDLYRQAGEPGQAAACLNMLSLTHVYNAALAEAQEAAEEAIRLSRVAGDRRQEAIGLRRLGITYGEQQRYDEQQEVTQAALALHRELGDVVEEVSALNNLGVIHNRAGRVEEAQAVLREALKLSHEIGSALGMLGAGYNLTTVLFFDPGRYEGALQFLDEQLGAARRANDTFRLTSFQRFKAIVLSLLGQYEQAIRVMEPIIADLGVHHGAAVEAASQAVVGEWWAELDNFPLGTQALDQATRLAERENDPRGLGVAKTCRANVALLQADPGGWEEPMRMALDAVALLRQTNEKEVLVDALHTAARVHLARNEVASALPCVEEIKTLMETTRWVSSPEQYLYTHSQVLRALGREEEADRLLAAAYDRVLLVARETTNHDLRKSWLENVRMNREIIDAWVSRDHG